MTAAPGRLLAAGRGRAPDKAQPAPWTRRRGRAKHSGLKVINEGLRAIAARWPIPVVVTLLAMLVTFAFAKHAKPLYQSSALILVQIRTPEGFGGASVNEQSSRDYLATQLDVIRSQQVALRVVDNLGPLGQAELQKAIGFDGAMTPDMRLKLAVWMLQRLHAVQGGGQSRALAIIFRAPFRHLNDVIVNGFVVAYREVVAERQAAPAEAAAKTVGAVLARERQKLLDTRAALSAGQQREQILIDNSLPSPEQQRLRALAYETGKMERLRAAAGGSLADQAILSGQADRVMRDLQLALADVEGRRALLAASAGPGSTDVRQLAAQAGALRAQIAARGGVMQSSVTAASSQAGAAGQAITSAVGVSRDQLLAAKGRASALRQLQSDAGNAGASYHDLLGARMQTDLLGRSQLSNVAVLQAAEEPKRPMWPRTSLMLAAALVFGLLVGCTLALGIEIFDRRLRAPEDIERRLGIDNLGEVRAFQSKRHGGWLSRWMPGRSAARGDE